MIFGTWPATQHHLRKSAFSWWNLFRDAYSLLRLGMTAIDDWIILS